MNANEENIYAVLHQFRNWNREWDKVIKSNAKSVDDFVIELAKTWEVNKKLHMNNQDFQWDDNKVKEFWMGNTIHNSDDSLNAAIEKFKASKQKPLEYEILEYGWQENQINMPDLQVPYKVKRLSDNVIFSINEISMQGRITAFHLMKDSSLTVETKGVHGHLNCYRLSEITKAEPKKEPILFKTADGVDNRAGDNYWKVWENFSCTKYQSSEGGDYPPLYIKTSFSAKESAESYITLNRPHLSVQDIVTAFSHVFYDKNSFMQELIELAKSKNK